MREGSIRFYSSFFAFVAGLELVFDVEPSLYKVIYKCFVFTGSPLVVIYLGLPP